MTFELATALVPKTGPSTILTVHPIEQPENITKERPESKAVFVEGSSSNLAPYEKEFWQHAPEWLRNGSIHPSPYRVIGGLEEVDEINAVLDGYMTAKGGLQAIVHP